MKLRKIEKVYIAHAILILIVAALIAIVAYESYEQGYKVSTEQHYNPFECYKWNGFDCVDKSSRYNCCNVVRGYCSVDICDS